MPTGYESPPTLCPCCLVIPATRQLAFQLRDDLCLSLFLPLCHWNFGASSRFGRESNHEFGVACRHVAA